MKFNKKMIIEQLINERNIPYIGTIKSAAENDINGNEIPLEYFAGKHHWECRILFNWNRRIKKNGIGYYAFLTRVGWNALKDEILPFYYKEIGASQPYDEFVAEQEQKVNNYYNQFIDNRLRLADKLEAKRSNIMKELSRYQEILSK